MSPLPILSGHLLGHANTSRKDPAWNPHGVPKHVFTDARSSNKASSNQTNAVVVELQSNTPTPKI